MMNQELLKNDMVRSQEENCLRKYTFCSKVKGTSRLIAREGTAVLTPVPMQNAKHPMMTLKASAQWYSTRDQTERAPGTADGGALGHETIRGCDPPWGDRNLTVLLRRNLAYDLLQAVVL